MVYSTPGTGKTTHASQLFEALAATQTDEDEVKWEHINVGDEFVKNRGCHSGFNEEWQSWDVDEDKVRFCQESFAANLGRQLTMLEWAAAVG